MIYVPASEIEAFGGLDAVGDKDSFTELKQTVLSPAFVVDEKPIKVNGTISYVEQKSWI